MQLTNMRRTAELLGVNYSALQSAMYNKKLPEPAMRIGSIRVFNPDEVEAARKYFEENRKKRESWNRK